MIEQFIFIFMFITIMYLVMYIFVPITVSREQMIEIVVGTVLFVLLFGVIKPKILNDNVNKVELSLVFGIMILSYLFISKMMLNNIYSQPILTDELQSGTNII
jgi:hypothetical protein